MAMNMQTLGLFIINMESLKTRIDNLRLEYEKVKSNVSRSSHQYRKRDSFSNNVYGSDKQ